MNIKENQKYQTTHRAIADALMESLKDKNIKQVTVTELCRTVHINRSTFYEHFLDVYDVLEKVAFEVSDELKCLPTDGEPTEADFLFLFNHIRVHRDFYSLYFRQGIPESIQAKMIPGEPPKRAKDIAPLKGITSDVQLEYHHAFFRAGLSAIIKNWLDRDCAESPEELYNLLLTEYQV